MNRVTSARTHFKLHSFTSSAVVSFALLLSGTCAWNGRAETPQTAFDAANKLYEQGKYTEGAGAYESILQTGSVSPALYFNLGNAFYKSGQIGRAILAYRQAQRLTPRDPDVRANLQFARNQVQGPTLTASRWERWLGALSLNEWTWLSSGAVWVTFLSLAAMRLWPESKGTLRRYTAAASTATVVLCACLGCALAQRFTVNTAVVVAQDAVVRNGPLEESPSAFIAHNGAELRVLDRKEDWLQVSDGGRRIGWLKLSEVALLKG